MHLPQPPIFVTVNAIARRAGKHRSVVDRLLRQTRLRVDAFVEIAGAPPQPVFLPDRALDVLKAVQSDRARRPASVTPPVMSETSAPPTSGA
jgi:hypothetical protein